MAMNPTDLYKVIGDRLRRIREQKRFSQQEMAGLLGSTTWASWEKYESGRKEITIHELFNIAFALNVELEDLIPKKSELTILYSKEPLNDLDL